MVKIKYRKPNYRQQRLIFLIGLPATGKSTVAKFLNERKSYEIVCVDKMIDKLALENNISVSKVQKQFRKEIFAEILNQISVVRHLNSNTIFDLPNLTTKERKAVMDATTKGRRMATDKIAIFFSSPLEGILERNKIRYLDKLDHEEDYLKSLYESIEPPGDFEFDYVIKVNDHEMKDYQRDYLNTLQKT